MGDAMNRRARARSGAEALRQELTDGIAAGRVRPGEKVATERSLAERFGLSRNTVRRVLDGLESEGWIERHVGRGTFVRAGPAANDAGTGPGGEVDSRAVNPEEVMEARLLIEPMLARLVVSRASERELEAMRALVRAGGEAASMGEFEHWDNKLHRAIAEASKNSFLIQIVEGIHRTRRSAGWAGLRRRGLTDDRRRLYQADHERIVEALGARDGEEAERAILEHLRHVRRNLLLT